MITKNSTFLKAISSFTALSILYSAVFPSMALALTSGPQSPDFASYEPVATTDMVDPFTGNFTYNIPLINIPGSEGAGYALSLSYHSGTSQEEEASWVGYGWTLNPGAINRGTKGFPDDYKDAEILQYNKTKPSWTASTGQDISLEFSSKSFAKDKEGGEGEGEGEGEEPVNENAPAEDQADTALTAKKPEEIKAGGGVNISLSMSSDLRYNNYRGFMRANSFGVVPAAP